MLFFQLLVYSADGTSAPMHESLSIGARVIIAVTFQQVDDAPDSKAGSECDHEGLQNVDCAVEKFHT